MILSCERGFTLVELLVALTIATITGAMLIKLVLGFQARIVAEINRNNLHDRTQRLVRFIANDQQHPGILIHQTSDN